MHLPLESLRVCALAGGVGGARLAHGLYRVLAPHRLTVVVNTGDDFERFGLRICPDLDTVMYTLAGLANPATGWGVVGDTFEAMGMMERYGEDTWFRLGDRDLATHVRRTVLLREGGSLTEVTGRLADSLGVRAGLLPMCDAAVATRITTVSGESLAFQEWFVRRGHRDEVARVTFDGIENAALSPEVADAIGGADAIVFCPSNPFVSVAPILEVPVLRAALAAAPARKVAVSPVVGGQALRGPAADMLRSLGHEQTALGVARLYRGLVDAFVLDACDAALAPDVQALGMAAVVAPSVMHDESAREALARRVLEAALPAPARR